MCKGCTCKEPGIQLRKDVELTSDQKGCQCGDACKCKGEVKKA